MNTTYFMPNNPLLAVCLVIVGELIAVYTGEILRRIQYLGEKLSK